MLLMAKLRMPGPLPLLPGASSSTVSAVGPSILSADSHARRARSASAAVATAETVANGASRPVQIR